MANILHVTTGNKLRVCNEQLIIIKENEEFQVSLEDFELIVVDNINTSFSAGALLLANKYKVPVVICNAQKDPEVFCYSEYSYYRLNKNLKDQVRWKTSNEKVNIIQAVIRQKITNQYKLLNYIDDVKYKVELKNISHYIDKLTNCNQSEIMQIEAITARIYFQALYGKEFNRREPSEINAALNYGYAILRSKIKAKIISKGLHPTMGIFHDSQFNNYNLADDIIEVYRGIVDYVVYYLMEFDEDFSKEEKQKLQQVILQKIEINNTVQIFDNTLEIFIQSIIDCFNKGDELLVPQLRIELYEF